MSIKKHNFRPPHRDSRCKGHKGRKHHYSNTGLKLCVGATQRGDTGLKSPDVGTTEALAGQVCRPEQRWDDAT